MQTSVHTIASNAGVEGAVVVGKLLEQDNYDLGYDAAKGNDSLSVFSWQYLFLTKDVWPFYYYWLYCFFLFLLHN